jgi:VWFA-related protein
MMWKPALLIASFCGLAAAQSVLPAGGGSTEASRTAPTFKVDVRLIEVYATVFDRRGKFVDGIGKERFEVLENGLPQPIVAFESQGSDLACAILLDTTGSMHEALPYVKNAAVRFIDQLRVTDQVAVYAFSESLQLLHGLTQDKASAKRAVLRTKAGGRTALFDGIAQTVTAMAKRKGRKAVVVFTDGDDNASVLNANAAIARAKKIGIPVFAVAQGEAQRSKKLFGLLEDVSGATGGDAYAARKPEEIRDLFDEISAQLQHLYMLAYAAPPEGGDKWRSIKVNLKALEKDDRFQIRAREGYFPD